ncbi:MULTISPECIES: PEP-CTERM sorting domain-containing protein [unclassified Nostoc]|uniref:PEP-CTERM sorting domain-containing protein n=1 Tax=unclassified Nostoc TaxID=2593658 RepID=UPI000CF307F8|nr:PEP-CTERM sorting domain-containing protein [Nostoc sp. 'Peltigera membranacea cyanobiont' N6]AVH62650.1 PEP-CTERM protein-sorting domain-containing protein [Nostoc sp. 'Peltigera membranacea cyanobiont' N6]
MINFKSTLLNATLAVIAAIPLATAGLFTSAGSAQAYTGSFNYSTSDRNFSDEATLSTLSKNFVNFVPNPGAILLTDRTGDFVSDSRGFIKSFQTNPFISPSEFIDVGALDGIKLLSLTSIAPAIFASGNAGIDITLNFEGLFNDGSKATGHFVFVTQNTAAKTTYDNGGTISGSFTGLAVTSVPEPAALLGLGAVGAVMAMSRRRKSFAQ